MGTIKYFRIQDPRNSAVLITGSAKGDNAPAPSRKAKLVSSHSDLTSRALHPAGGSCGRSPRAAEVWSSGYLAPGDWPSHQGKGSTLYPDLTRA